MNHAVLLVFLSSSMQVQALKARMNAVQTGKQNPITHEEVNAEFKRFCLQQMDMNHPDKANDKKAWQVPTSWLGRTLDRSFNISLLEGPTMLMQNATMLRQMSQHPRLKQKYNPADNGEGPIAYGMSKYLTQWGMNPTAAANIAHVNTKAIIPPNDAQKSYLSDYPVSCYEEVPGVAKKAKDPFILEKALFEAKLAPARVNMFSSSFILYGRNCRDRGFSFNKGMHPCYPHYVSISWLNAKGKESFERYRQDLIEKSLLGRAMAALNQEPIDIADWMASGKCERNPGETGWRFDQLMGLTATMHVPDSYGPVRGGD